MIFIYRQEIIQDIRIFTKQPKINFYQLLFDNLDLSHIPEHTAKTGRPGTSNHALICAFIVMKCECFAYVSDLYDYLCNNLIIAYYCGFDITKPLPSYDVFKRFIKKLDNSVLKSIMQSQVLKLANTGLIDTSFIGLDSTPVHANTSHNNPKSFKSNKFKKDNPPKSDSNCRLGVHTASNQHNEKNYEFYWGYKNHILVDCISGLPIYEITTPANTADSTIVKDILEKTDSFLSVKECSFIADKGYDAKHIYNLICNTYEGECFIPLNTRGQKPHNILKNGAPVCAAGLAMNRDGKYFHKKRDRIQQKFCCPFKHSKNDSVCPCKHEKYNKSEGKKSRGCTIHIELPTKTGEIRLDIDRGSKLFKSVYRLRTEVERYNSRYKNTGSERVWVRNQASVTNLNTFSHIALLAVAIACVITKKNVSYRSLKALKRSA